MNVGEYIRKLRIENGLSQSDLGKIIGVQRAAVQKWECGRVQNLKRETIKKLSELFNVSPSTFITEEDETDLQIVISDQTIKIYERIKKIREELDMSQEELAIKVGFESRSAICKIENGQRKIDTDLLFSFAVALKTTPIYLLEGTIDLLNLSPHEKELVTAYRNKPDFRNSVNKLLDIPNEEPTAPPEPTSKNIVPDMQSEFENIKNKSPQKSKNSK